MNLLLEQSNKDNTNFVIKLAYKTNPVGTEMPVGLRCNGEIRPSKDVSIVVYLV